jgi:cyanophycin synthetase
MELLETKVMRGPNYWSDKQHRLIVLKIDTQDCDGQPKEKREKVYDLLNSVVPNEAEPSVSSKANGEASGCADLVAHAAIALQQAAGIDISYSHTVRLREQKWAVIFAYVSESAGLVAGESAFECVKAAFDGKPFDAIAAVNAIKEAYGAEILGPSTQSIIDEAVNRNIPFRIADEYSVVQLGYGKKQKLFQATVLQTTSDIAVDLVGSKWTTKNLLAENAISVPRGIEVRTEEELFDAVEQLGTPVVVKPLDGNHGRGITANLFDKELIREAFHEAVKISDTIIVEQHVHGADHRLLVINYKFVAAAKRTPAMITGDGKSTIRQLVDKVNEDPRRGEGHENVLTEIDIDEHTMMLLREQELTPDSVLKEGEQLMLKRTANLSSGGTAEDVTDIIHPFNRDLAERIARLMRLDVCGIDVVAKDITLPVDEENGAIIEVNAGPGFRMHTHPSEGTPRNVAEPVIDMLFPKGDNGRIPIVAVTGTNGKTTVVRIVAHIAGHAGKKAGFTTTEGIYIDNKMVYEGDCSGPKSAAVVLNDPSVDFAVLECARGGILRSGLAFDQCDVSVVTNVTEDHLGLGDIYTMDEYAKVKLVVPQSTSSAGTAILNADDDRVFDMKSKVSCRVMLFSENAESDRVAEHCNAGGSAIVIRDGAYVLREKDAETEVMQISEIPLTEEGKSVFMVKNLLAGIAAALSSGFSMDAIREALREFKASPETTPGRMNLFKMGNVPFLLDYAHNAAGYQEIGKYMENVGAGRKVGIIAATGDRLESDIVRQGEYAARIFDEVIIRHDKDGRGRSDDELTGMLRRGIEQSGENTVVRVISDEEEAMRAAIENADEDTFIFASADKVMNSIAILKKLEDTYK